MILLPVAMDTLSHTVIVVIVRVFFSLANLTILMACSQLRRVSLFLGCVEIRMLIEMDKILDPIPRFSVLKVN